MSPSQSIEPAEFASLDQLSAALSAGVRIDGALESALRWAARRMGVAHGALWLLNPSDDRLRVAASVGLSGGLLEKVAGQIRRSDEPEKRSSASLASSSRPAGGPASWLEELPERS